MRSIATFLKLREDAGRHIRDLPSLVMHAQSICQNVSHGLHPRRKSGSGDEFWQFREYISGDRPQDIDWRQSAKGNSVLVRQREQHSAQRSYIWCSHAKSMHFQSGNSTMSKQECAMIFSMALAMMLIRGEEHIGHWGNLKTGRSDARINKIGDYLLSSDQEKNALPMPDHFTLPKDCSFFACGDFFAQKSDIEACFSKLSERTANGVIIQILDPAEISFPYRGRIRFKGSDQNQDTLLEQASSIQDDYKMRINAHLKFMKDICQRHGWHYALHITDQSIAESLSNIAQNLQHYQTFEGCTS